MSKTIAAIDVHKKVLMVVTGADAGDSHRFATTRDQLEQLTQWLQARGIEQVVMESTAQYWKPVWQALEPNFRLHWRRPNPIARRAAANTTSATPAACCAASWRAS